MDIQESVDLSETKRKVKMKRNLEVDRIVEICVWSVLFLSLECVLEGLVSGGEIRGWVFHAIAVAGCTVAIFRKSDLTAQISMVCGLVAFFNEFILLQDASIPLKFIVPSFVLFGVSMTGFVLLLGVGQREISMRQGSSGFNGPKSGIQREPLSPPPYAKVPGTPPLAPPPITKRIVFPSNRGSDLSCVIGGLIVVYSLSMASWIDLEKWFGLRTATVGFAELRDVESIVDGVSTISSAYFSIGFLGSYLVAALAIGSVLLRRTQFSIEHLRPGRTLLGLTPLFGIWHTVLVLELSQDGGNNFMSAGGWAGSFGLLLIAIGSFLSR